jgi:amino acid transporter
VTPATKTRLGLVTLTCLIAGNMIGVAIYVNSYYSLMSLKDARLVLLVWLVGGLHALCGAIAYGAVASRLPISGGEYTYLSRCIHPAIGLVAGWISIIAGFTAPIAASALLLANYALQFADTTLVDPADQAFKVRWIATFAIVSAAILHGFHLKIGTSFNNSIIALKFGCFALFLFVGIPFVLRTPCTGMLYDTTLAVAPSLVERLSEPNTWLSMLVQLFYVSLAYTGFNASIYLAGDIETSAEGKRSLIARSMWVSCLAVMVLYLLLNTVFLYGVDPQELIKSGEGFVAVVARNVGGNWLSLVMQLAILLSAATSVLAMMATGPMVYTQMARDGWLPKFLLGGNDSSRWPIAIQAALSCVVVWVSSIEGIISYLGLTLTACGALAVSSIWFAKKGLVSARPVTVMEHMATAIYIAGALLLLFAASQTPDQRIKLYLCLATFAVGAIVYAVVGAMRTRRSLGQ